MQWNSRTLPASFGTGTTVWWISPGDGAPLTVLFHGVHSTGRPVQGSKFAYLAQRLYQAGCAVALCESSRLNLENEGLPSTAFEGKTFTQEIDDFRACLDEALSQHPAQNLTLWGFSLGGVAAALCAVDHPDCLLVQSGTGTFPRKDRQNLFDLPLLNTLPPTENLCARAKNARPRTQLAFWGDEDKTFSEDSCRQAAAVIDCKNARFTVCPGADHGFRRHKGLPSTRWLDYMANQVISEIQ